MNTNYEMWITYNAEHEKLRIPVLPEKFNVSIGSRNSTVDLVGLGEVVIKQSRPAYQFSFSSFFPARRFPGMSVRVFAAPMLYVGAIQRWIEGKKPVHLIIANLAVSTYCTIEKFSYYEEGGDVGTIYYDLTFKEYKEVSTRRVKVEPVYNPALQLLVMTGTVQPEEQRVDNSVSPLNHVVQPGDTLWSLARMYYGDGSLYTKIYEANKDAIGANPNNIHPGQVLAIPT